MAVLVTGGAGFIGSHVGEALVARGEQVVVLDDLSSGSREKVPEGAELRVGDIRSPDDVFDDVEPTLCFHLAAQADVGTSVERPAFDADVNVLGTLRVLEAARRHGTKVVFSSTGGAIYGECDGPAPETAERKPISPYGISKLAGEEYLVGWNRLFESKHVALRFGNVYGPRQEPSLEGGVIAIFLDRMRDGQPTQIFGDGRQTRDFVYVKDIVDAVLRAAEYPGGVFNIGTGVETSVLDLHEACRRVTGVDHQPDFGEARAGDVLRSVIDPSLAGQELGWRAQHSVDEGLRETWESMSG